PVPNTYEPQPTCFRIGTLAPGASYPPITLRVAVANNTEPSVTNAVTAASGDATDSSTGTDPTTVSQLPALAVSSFPAAAGVPYPPFTRGNGKNVYQVTVSNDGYGPTTGPVSFTLDLPGGLAPTSITAPAAWSCTLSAATCTTSNGASLAAGQ